jgi:hypothetical protein
MENSSFSVKENAGKSFKTFMLTLSISLIVFSGVYYVLTMNSSGPDSHEVSVVNKSGQNAQVAKVSTENQKSVFGELAARTPEVMGGAVLAGATGPVITQTTQSGGNLNTGTMSVTFGLVGSLVLFLIALVIVSRNPRKLALLSFEKSTTKGLDEKK